MNIEKQVDTFIKLGLHKALGQEEDEYRLAFKSFAPINQHQELEILTVVDPRINHKKVCEVVGIHELIPSFRLTNSDVYPNTPYAFWTHNGSRYSGQSLEGAKRLFAPEEMGCTLAEVLALYLIYPELFRKRAIISSETSYEDYYPYVSTIGKKPAEIFFVRPSFMLPGWGVLSRSKQVTIFAQ